MASRIGRHMAAASTWILRSGLIHNREDAIKLIKKERVLFDRVVVHTGYLYKKPVVIKILTEDEYEYNRKKENRKK